jgi:hypothetical protein
VISDSRANEHVRAEVKRITTNDQLKALFLAAAAG